MNAAGQTISLCMIVKNEAPVIRRCLDSVRPLIDHWVIVDTEIVTGKDTPIHRGLTIWTASMPQPHTGCRVIQTIKDLNFPRQTH